MHHTTREAYAAYLQQWKENDALYHQLAQHLGFRSDAAFWLLIELTEGGEGRSPSELCQSCCLSKQTGHSALASLEKAGLLSLAPDPVHARRKLVRLTESGRRMARERIRPLLEGEFAAFSRLTGQEQATLLALNQRVMEYLKEEVAGRYPGLEPL